MGVFADLLAAREGVSEAADPMPGQDRRAIHLSAAALAVAFLVFRAWTLFPSWFYADDHRLLTQAREQGLSLDYLATPFDSQFMPLGRLIAWLVAQSEVPSWPLAVCLTLVLLAGSVAACWWMLVVVFGERVEVLALLGLFLGSTLSLPASMWWAASLNQLPMLIAWCGAVAAAVLHLRTRRTRWLAVVIGFLAFGLLAYVKTLLVVPVLFLLALSYFSSGSLLERAQSLIRTYRLAAASVTALSAAFTAYYLIAVPAPFESGSQTGVAGPVADRLIGTSWASAVVGGPWRWDAGNAPVGVTDPPNWWVHLAWIAIAMVVAYAFLRRTRTLRGWALLAVCLAFDYLLLMLTRAPFFGAVAGNEMRYLTEAAAAVVLCLGLVLLPVRGAVESSAPRAEPLLRRGLDVRAGGALACFVGLASVVSTVTYAHIWHSDNPGEAYVEVLSADVRSLGRVDVADTQVPPDVMPPLTLPYNRVSVLSGLHVPGVSFPAVSSRLMVTTEQGHLVPAAMDASMTAAKGPTTDCGWKVVGGKTRTIDLPGRTLDVPWWVRVGYLSSEASPVVVTAGDTSEPAQVQTGLGALFVKLPGGFDSITFSDLADGTTLCVDQVEVGVPTAGVNPS